MSRFTMEEVGWEPRLPPVEEASATPEQIAALDACPPAQRRSVYFRTLVHDPGSLGERGALFTKVMYAPKGLPRAERARRRSCFFTSPSRCSSPSTAAASSTRSAST